jgi:hypothetical protein
MPRGKSGRIVIEINPELKRALHSQLAKDGSTMKDWFIRNAATFLEDRSQPFLFDPNELRSIAKNSTMRVEGQEY